MFGTGGSTTSCPDGGGGSGYYGGGSGGCNGNNFGGGGGGSGILASGVAVVSRTTNSADGTIVIAYNLPIATSTALQISPHSGATSKTVLTLPAAVAARTGNSKSTGTVILYGGTTRLSRAD